MTDEAALNSIGYVVSRYVTGNDLERLTRAEDPWRDVDRIRPEHGSVRIRNEDIERFFRGNLAGPDDAELDAAELTAWLRRASPDRPTRSVDTVESIRARGRSHG